MWAGVHPPLEAEDRHLPQGILVGIGSVVVIAAGFVASAFPQADAMVRYGVLVLAVLGFTAATVVWTAPLVTAFIGFLVFGGFLVNQFGELSWHGSADLIRLIALGAAVIFGRLLGDIFRLPGKSAVEPSKLRRPQRSMASSPFIKEDEHDA